VSVWREGALHAQRALTSSADDPAAFADELGWTLPALGAATTRLAGAGPSLSPALEQALAHHAFALAPLDVDEAPGGGPTPAAVRASPVACALALGALQRDAVVAFPRATRAATFVTPRLRRLAVAAAVLGVLDLGLLRLDLTHRAARTHKAVIAEATRALPGEPVVAPRAQLEAALAARRSGTTAGGSALVRLREVSERVPEGLAVDLHRLALEGERLQLAGSAPTFESVEVLRRALAGSARLRDVTTDDVRTTVDGGHVSFRLQARWVPPGEAAS
jgi:hypothetical protein